MGKRLRKGRGRGRRNCESLRDWKKKEKEEEKEEEEKEEKIIRVLVSKD